MEMVKEIRIVKMAIVPLQFIISAISGLFSFFFLKNEIAMFLPEISTKYVDVMVFITVFCIELLIMVSIYFGVQIFKNNKNNKLSIFVILITLPLFAINFILTSKGSELLVDNKLNKTHEIKTYFQNDLKRNIDSINSKIAKYEKILNRNDSIGANYINKNIILSNIQFYSSEIKTMKNERVDLLIKSDKNISSNIKDNDLTVQTSKYKYYLFSISLIVLIFFFNSASAILTYFKDSKNELPKDKNELHKIDNKIFVNNLEKTILEQEKTIEEQIILIEKDKNLIEKMDVNYELQRNNFIKFIQVDKLLINEKKGRNENNKSNAEKLDVIRADLKQKLNLNGQIDNIDKETLLPELLKDEPCQS